MTMVKIDWESLIQKVHPNLEENQEEVPALLWTKEGRVSGAITATHTHTHILEMHTSNTETQGNTGKRFLLCTSLTILCLGKKNINLSSLRGSALVSHLQPT